MKLIIAWSAVAATIVAARPNNWAVPCFEGECAYDLHPSTGSSGHIKIAGSPHAITDITPAAGWVVLDCDPNRLDQEIRLVCNSHDMEEAGCAHFFEGGGPVDKYARLPESCSTHPFVRVASAMVHEDQSIPHHKHDQIERRDGAFPQVYAVRIDDQFHEIDDSKFGDVTFAVAGVAEPGVDMSFDMPHDIHTKEGADRFVEAAKQLMEERSAAAALSKREDIDTKKVEPFNYVAEIPFTTVTKSCKHGSATASAMVGISLKAKVDGHLKLGMSAVGDAAKKQLTSFAEHFFDFSITIEQDLRGKIELSGAITLGDFKIITPTGVPSLSLDLKFIKVGTMFELLGHMTGHIDVGVEIDTHVVYGIEKATFDFPATGSIKPMWKDGSYTLKINPGSDKVATLKVGIIPKLLFGIQVFGIKPDVYLSFGAYTEGSIKPKKAIELKSGEKFDIKKVEICGEVKGLLDANIGAELALFSIWKGNTVKNIWKKEFDFWKSASCPKAKREFLALDAPLASNVTMPNALVSRSVHNTDNIKINIPSLSTNWACETSTNSPTLGSIAESVKVVAKALGL
ncbi:hypothetical protein BDN71DRAFT_1450204 [Pleurotus eryngii]|uniref:Uncharacterized protein n=1 Tax=Pleurotus eryngii TaxID=5323 RepID=A0A9P6DER5_PLEER|nr:hypothetical protein BDN71DRAFT_1450204 [Pleurotus eryngii]